VRTGVSIGASPAEAVMRGDRQALPFPDGASGMGGARASGRGPARKGEAWTSRGHRTRVPRSRAQCRSRRRTARGPSAQVTTRVVNRENGPDGVGEACPGTIGPTGRTFVCQPYTGFREKVQQRGLPWPTCRAMLRRGDAARRFQLRLTAVCGPIRRNLAPGRRRWPGRMGSGDARLRAADLSVDPPPER
jgi:hypothetical protein